MNTLFCLIGASGSGKTTLALELEKQGYKILYSYTTRPKRRNNEWGHIFISTSEFESNTFVAYNCFNGHWYGVTIQQIEGNDIYIVDPKGYYNLRLGYRGNKRIIPIYIDCDFVTRYDRLCRRDGIEKALKKIVADGNVFKTFKKTLSNEGYKNNIVNNAGDMEESLSSVQKIMDYYLLFQKSGF